MQGLVGHEGFLFVVDVVILFGAFDLAQFCTLRRLFGATSSFFLSREGRDEKVLTAEASVRCA